MNPSNYRRRRKRARARNTDGDTLQEPSRSSLFVGVKKNDCFRRRRMQIPSSCLEDDSGLKFLDSDGDALSSGRVIRSNLPVLLEERRLGKWKLQRDWQSKALVTFTQKPKQQEMSRRQWREFAARSIPFTHLGTPSSDAVLALERNGSYVLSLGAAGTTSSANSPSSSGRGVEEPSLALALRFYGIPSPAAVNARKGSPFGPSPNTPLLQTTPLLYEINNDSAEDAIFNFRRNVSPATTPVKILVSSDWRLGVAIFQPSNVWREEGVVGSLVLFTLPHRSVRNKPQTIYQCVNVRVGGADDSFTARNLLWHVNGVPTTPDMPKNNVCIFDSIYSLPGYLFLNDEEDGFRLTWAMDAGWNTEESTCKNSQVPNSPLRNGIDSAAFIVTSQDTWERFHYDCYSGKRLFLDDEKKNLPQSDGIRVISEAFLHVDALLGEILDRRKNMPESNPEFIYNLISLQYSGRVADLIITFIRKKKPGSLGVFVQVDLFTGRFQEQDWVKSLDTKDASALRKWCNALALNRRMKQVRAGPYSVEINAKSTDWGRLCKESYFDNDKDDDLLPSVWKEYVESAESTLNRKAPKMISFSSLYPACDLITNMALTSCLPVASLRSKHSPIKLIYG